MFNGLVEIPKTELTELEFREWIESEQTEIEKSAVETFDRHSCLTQDGFRLEQAMTPGLYIRELTMPADSTIFSKVHLQTHPFMITKGKVTVYDGKTLTTHEAPYKGVTQSGTKRLLYIHEDTTWITFHPTDSDDLELMDKNGVITCDTFKEYDEIIGVELCHLQA